jgi:hypothetical protein
LRDIWIPIVFFAFVLTIIYYSIASRRKLLSKLTNSFNGSISSNFFSPVFNGQYQGLNFFIKLIPGGKNSPPYLMISLAKDCELKLTIYRETALSQVGEKIGLVHEVKVDDETFDREFLIFSSDPERARNYLSSADIKNAIRETFAGGFDSLKATRKSIAIMKPSYDSNSDFEPQKISSALQRLSVIMKGL